MVAGSVVDYRFEIPHPAGRHIVKCGLDDEARRGAELIARNLHAGFDMGIVAYDFNVGRLGLYVFQLYFGLDCDLVEGDGRGNEFYIYSQASFDGHFGVLHSKDRKKEAAFVADDNKKFTFFVGRADEFVVLDIINAYALKGFAVGVGYNSTDVDVACHGRDYARK